MQLSLTERLILANQCRIMELVDPGNAEDYARKQDALKSGYELDIDDLVSGFAQGEDALTWAECREVYDILDMFRPLGRAYDELDDQSGFKENDIRFEGFDILHEEKQYHYSHYLSQKGDYPELMPGQGINSGHPTLDRYRLMVAAWKRIPQERRFQLSKEDIQHIVASGRGEAAPENVTSIR